LAGLSSGIAVSLVVVGDVRVDSRPGTKHAILDASNHTDNHYF
jgi:hypothetical protein